MKVRRNIASLPVRSALETWDAIVKLISGAGSVDVAQLGAAASIVSSAIGDELTAEAPILVKGVGDRLVIYTTHGADAMELGLAVDKLTWNPTAGDAWAMTVPCSAEDVAWMSKALKERAPRITVHDKNEKADVEPVRKAAPDVEIDWSVLEKS